MSILKKFAIVAFCATLSIGAKATTPKTETKTNTEATVSPADSKSESKLNTYYVTGMSGSNYTLSTTPPSGGCKGGASPCEITSPNPLGSTVAKTEVDNEEDDIQITEFQPQLH